MINEDKSLAINENFEYGKTCYFDKSGISINENEVKSLSMGRLPIIKTCCKIELPKGFNFTRRCPRVCFNLSNLKCIKVPMTQKVSLEDRGDKEPFECKAIVGYEVRAVGEVNFSISTPLIPKNGGSFPGHSHSCCNSTVCVNESIGYSCCPKPCPKEIPCVDWSFAYFTVRRVKDTCNSSYLQVTVYVALEYMETSDCDDE